MEKIVKRRKIKFIVTKRQKARGIINLSIEKEGNYKCDNKNKTNLDHVGNNKYLLQL